MVESTSVGTQVRPEPMEADRARGWTLAEIAHELQERRSAAGHPSYTEITRRIARLRAERGVPAAEQRPARATVYDCFRTDRRRLDIDLVADIVRAFGADDAEVARWARTCQVAQRQADAATVVTAYAGLPSEDDDFVGRAAELATLLAADAPAYAIEGMPGSGKSRLAVHAAGRLIETGRVTGAIFADLRGFHPSLPAADPAAVVEALLRMLDVAGRQLPTGHERRRALLGRLLEERPQVIVLDDAADAEQLRPILPDAPGSVVLVTSRTGVAAELGIRPIQLGAFSADEAMELLRRVVGDGLVDAEPAAARELVEASGCQPLAVGVTARRIAARSGWSLADHIAPLLTRLRAGRLDDAVQATLALSYAALSPAARTTLRLLAAQPCADLDALDVAVLTATDDATDDDGGSLGELSWHHLVTQPRPGRYGLHAVVRTYALDRSLDEDRPAERDAALWRLSEHMVEMVWSGYVHGRPPAAAPNRSVPAGVVVPEEPPAGLEDWLKASVENVLAVAAAVADSDHAATVNRLSDGIAWRLNRHGPYAAARVLHRLALDTATATGERVDEARARLDLGMILVRMGERDEGAGHLAAAAEIFDATGDLSGTASAINSLGIIDIHAGRIDEAVQRFQRSVEYARAAGHGYGAAAALDNIAIAQRRAGRLDQAVVHHHEALREAERLGDRFMQASSLTNLSEVQLLLGRHDDALATARSALAIGHEIGSPPVIAYSSDNTGNALAATGAYREALPHHEEALRISRTIGDRHLEASVLTNLGADLLGLDELDSARDRYDQAAALAGEIGDAFERARALGGLGGWHLARGAADEARRCWTEALAAFERLNSPEAADIRERLAGLPS